MSAAYAAPDPDDRRDTPAGDADLSDRDRRILDEISGHENGADPTFVARLREPARPAASPATERVLQVLAVAAVLAVLLPTAWVMVGVVVLVIVVLPAVLGWAARRAGGPGPRPARR